MQSEIRPSGTPKVPREALDRIDRQILRALQKDGRLPISELARSVHLTPTPCYERVKRLEHDGYIKGYAALVNPSLLGLPVLIFVEIRVDRTTADVMDKFEAAIHDFDEVMECHSVTGSFDYMIKVRVADMATYRRFVSTRLRVVPGAKQTRTFVVMEEVKSSPSITV